MMRRTAYPTLLALTLAAASFGLALADGLPGRSASDLVAEGNELFAKGDYEGALKKYLEAQTLKPNSPELHFNIGDVEYGKGKFDSAANEFRRVLAGGEKRLLPGLAYNLATAAAKQKQMERAIDLYKAAIKLDPNDVEARHNLGVLLDQKNKQEQKQDNQDQDKDKKQEQKQDQKQQKQGGQGQQDKQQQQQQQQQQQNDQQKSQQKNQQQAGQPQQNRKDEQGHEPPAPKPDKKDEKDEKDKQASAGKQEKDKDQGSGAGEIAGAIPREQAERLLDLLKEDEKQNVMMGQPHHSDEPELDKDW